MTVGTVNPAVLFCNIAALRCCGIDIKYLQNSVIVIINPEKQERRDFISLRSYINQQ